MISQFLTWTKMSWRYVSRPEHQGEVLHSDFGGCGPAPGHRRAQNHVSLLLARGLTWFFFSLTLTIGLPLFFLNSRFRRWFLARGMLGMGVLAAEKTVLTPPPCGWQPVCSRAAGPRRGAHGPTRDRAPPRPVRRRGRVSEQPGHPRLLRRGPHASGTGQGSGGRDAEQAQGGEICCPLKNACSPCQLF